MAGKEEKSARGGKRRKRAGPVGVRVQAYGKDGPQRVRSWGKRFTPEAEAVFLAGLRGSCNVRYSADQCGFTPTALYARRKRDAGFAERWRLARDDGFARIEALLVERAEEALSGQPEDPQSPIPTMTVGEAISILKLHRPSVTGEGRTIGRSQPRPLGEMKGSILRKLSSFERARRRGEFDHITGSSGESPGEDRGAAGAAKGPAGAADGGGGGEPGPEESAGGDGDREA